MIGGIVNVLKPPGMTSHDVVSCIRRIFSIKRVGHAGTLDPAAAGVLPIAVGSSTRLIEYFTAADKKYRVELTFGLETDTGDDTGVVLRTKECSCPGSDKLTEVLYSFIGTSSQVPPMHSAIKISGKKMYELARSGIKVDIPGRVITIHDICLLNRTEKTILFDVWCSKGTYIRSLCADIGKKLNLPVVMSFLVRTKVGGMCIDDALTLEEITADPQGALMPADLFLDYMPKVSLDEKTAMAFMYGQKVKATAGEFYGSDSYNCLVRVYKNNTQFIGIGQRNIHEVVPLKVFSS